MNLKLAVFRDIGTGLNAHEEKNHSVRLACEKKKKIL